MRSLLIGLALISAAAASVTIASCATSGTIDTTAMTNTGGGSGGSDMDGSAAGTGGSGTSGAGGSGTSGTGGSSGSGGATDGSSTGGSTSCASTQKRCGGICVDPAPGVGCDLTSCTACTTVVDNADPACVAGQCDFTCHDGFVRSGSSCVQGDGGTMTCTPRTCADVPGACGSLDDGCGSTVNCQDCTAPATCGGAGVANQCGCGSDTDGDGVDDCTEDADGDPWTDATVFNGMHVRRANQCSASGNCGENDTLSEVDSCMQNVAEELDQYSGWDWEDPPNNICDSGYAFLPNWTGCDSTWAADWQGCIHLTSDGPHCFQITGGTNEGCAALYFNGNTGNADAQSGTGPVCFNVSAGDYPIRWHYTMDDGSSSSMHVQYCDAAGGGDCTPSTAIPSRMLRTQCP